jgi:hypothetical protein
MTIKQYTWKDNRYEKSEDDFESKKKPVRHTRISKKGKPFQAGSGAKKFPKETTKEYSKEEKEQLAKQVKEQVGKDISGKDLDKLASTLSEAERDTAKKGYRWTDFDWLETVKEFLGKEAKGTSKMPTEVKPSIMENYLRKFPTTVTKDLLVETFDISPFLKDAALDLIRGIPAGIVINKQSKPEDRKAVQFLADNFASEELQEGVLKHNEQLKAKDKAPAGEAIKEGELKRGDKVVDQYRKEHTVSSVNGTTVYVEDDQFPFHITKLFRA